MPEKPRLRHRKKEKRLRRLNASSSLPERKPKDKLLPKPWRNSASLKRTLLVKKQKPRLPKKHSVKPKRRPKRRDSKQMKLREMLERPKRTQSVSDSKLRRLRDFRERLNRKPKRSG